MADVMDELNDKIAKLLGQSYTPSDHIKMTFTPPIVLMLQLFETTLSSVGNILQVFSSIPGLKVDPLYLLQRYVPYINWTEFNKAGSAFASKLKMETPQQQ